MHFDLENSEFDEEWLRQAAQIEQEANCDIGAGAIAMSGPTIAKVSIERLWHFQCGNCQGWWTVGDYKPKLMMTTCPHCSCLNDIPDEVLTENDFQAEAENPPPRPPGPSLEELSEMLRGGDRPNVLGDETANLVGFSSNTTLGEMVARAKEWNAGMVRMTWSDRNNTSTAAVVVIRGETTAELLQALETEEVRLEHEAEVSPE